MRCLHVESNISNLFDPQWLRQPYLLLDCVIRAFINLLTTAGETPITCKQANNIPESYDMSAWAYNYLHYNVHLTSLLKQIVHKSPNAEALWADVFGNTTQKHLEHLVKMSDTHLRDSAAAQVAFFAQAAQAVNVRAVAVARISLAWRRAYYNPAYALCRRRILREFGELADDLRVNGWAKNKPQT